jgi:hypothetical protein
MMGNGEMPSLVEEAVTCFKERCSCSLAILTTYGPLVGLDRELATRSDNLLIRGKVPNGRVCVAVSAAIVVLGLKYRTLMATEDAGDRIREFARRVESCRGSLSCQYVPGSNSKPDPRCVQHIAEILEKALGCLPTDS